MTQFRGTSFGETEAEKEEKKAAAQQEIDEKKIADAKAKKDAKEEPAAHKVERKEPPKKAEEKSPEPRKTRVTVLRDLVEDLESDSNISDEQRRAFQELNRRLTRALAK